MIRQAVSCDICGNEKRQTNHWFVAYEHAGELRVSGWNSRARSKAGTKHLCGQTCLHKLVDEFIARAEVARPQTGIATGPAGNAASERFDISLTSNAAYGEMDSSARLIAPARFPVAAVGTTRLQQEIPAMPAASMVDSLVPPEPRFTSRNWRAEAWQRERERELRAADRLPEIARRRSSA